MRTRITLLAVVVLAAAWPLWVNAQRDSKPHAIVFDGSSSIEYWDLKSSFPDLDVVNEGIGGTEITDSLKTEARNVIAHHPRIVVFYSGDNDIGGGVTPQDVAAHFDQYAAKLHAALPQAKLVVISIKPSVARWSVAGPMREANALIQQHVKTSPWIAFVDIQDQMLGPDGKPRRELFVADGLHMTPAGYRIWTTAVRPHLN
jgi:lysophospholipase L1-like esterase